MTSNRMACACLTLVMAMILSGNMTAPSAAQDQPKVLLYVPFDGSADAAFAADGYGKAAYTTISYHPGRWGQAAQVGSTGFPCGLMIPAALNLDTVRGSLEMWVSLTWDASDATRAARRRVLVANERDWNEPGFLCLDTAGGGIGFTFRTPESVHVGGSVAAWKRGEWHQIVVSWEAGQGVWLYLDGREVSHKEAAWDAGRVPPPRRLHLCADCNGRDRFEGLVDEFRIYDRALTAEQVAAAFEGTLDAPRAEIRAPARPPVAQPKREPRLLFHATFDDTATADFAAGSPQPLEAQNVQFADGLVGRALSAQDGLALSYSAAGNLNKSQGAVTMWIAPTEEGLDANCAYFADEYDTWQNPQTVKNALWVWLWRAGDKMPFLRFDVRPPLLQADAKEWQPGEWHHIAACWTNGEELSLYIDGVLAQTLTGSAASFPVEEPEKFFIGCWQGGFPARALIDDVRIYDAPLSAEQVLAQARERVLPVHLDLGRTLFERGVAGTLPLRFYNSAPQELTFRLQARVDGPTGQQVATFDGLHVVAPPRGWGEVSVSLPAEALAAEGVYNVTCAVGDTAKKERAYFLVVPPLPDEKPSDGDLRPQPRLRLVDEIDCTADLGPDRFASTDKTTVVDSPIGAYREAGPDRYDRMAWKFRVEHPGRWHVIVVAYPDDKPRSCDIISNSPKYYQDVYDVATGYLCGVENRLSGRMIQFPIWFTPREQENAIEFMTLEKGRPAAVAKINVYEVEGSLPAASVRVPPDGGRLIGNYWEDPTICLEHGGLDFSPPEVYKSFYRLADYLRFSGQNFICYPIAWYIGTMYPSPRENFRMGAGFFRHCVDWVEYALTICERRGLKFLPEMYFAGTMTLEDQWKQQPEEDIWAGEETPKLVMWDGTQSRGFYFQPPYYNPIHPIVRQALIEYVEEAVDRYAKYPALEGISLLVGQGNCVFFGSLQSGYDDYTVGLFEKETGIRVPADATGPARFSQRFRWLMANAREEWIRWRCEKIRDLHKELADRIRRRRPDLKLYLTFYHVDGHNWNPMYNLDTWVPSGRTTEQIYREGGFDLSLYRDLPGIVLRRVMYPIDYRFFTTYYGAGGPNSHESLARDIELLSEGIGPFKNSALPAAAFHCRYFESSIGADSPIPGFWWKCHPWRVSQPTAAGRNFLEFYAHAVAELDACSLAYGGYTVTSLGHEDELREFAQYYRALPAQRFRDVPGMSDPVCARELTAYGRRYLYLVNLMPYEVKAYVAFGGPATIEDLATGERKELPMVRDRVLPAAAPDGFVSEHDLPAEPGPSFPPMGTTQPVSGALLEVTLPAYGLLSLAVSPVNAPIIYAASEVPAAEVEELSRRLNEARRLVADADAPDDHLQQAMATLRLAERAFAKREYSRAGYLLDSFPIARLQRR
ncbi:MAG: family 10 glycosylhydrolase [Armatimonadetes bacterium]|nr:family 10 glycosylhydrolase [Armatimonadota bacterium]